MKKENTTKQKTIYLMRNGIPIKKEMFFLNKYDVIILEYNLIDNTLLYY